MASPLAYRVADRFNNRTSTVIYRDNDLLWGWFTKDAPPRMHVTLLSPGLYQDGIVWLEDRGTRVTSSTGYPHGMIRGLFAWIWDNREAIEARWLRFMEMKGWLGVRLDDDQLVLVCYPGEETEFTRPLDASVWSDRKWRAR